MSLSKCTPFQKVEVSGTLDNNSVLFSAQRMSIAYFYLDLKLQTAQCLHAPWFKKNQESCLLDQRKWVAGHVLLTIQSWIHL